MIKKLVYESIIDVLKPKSEEEIDKIISGLDKDQIMMYGISYEKPNWVKIAIDKGSFIDETDLDVMNDDVKWDKTIEYYIKKIEKIDIYKTIYMCLRLKKYEKSINLINKCKDEDLKKIKLSLSIADYILNYTINHSKEFDEIKLIFNTLKIKKNLNDFYFLADSLFKKILSKQLHLKNNDFYDILESLLKN